MSYKSKLFGTIPYEVRNSDKAIYSEQVVEHALLDYYDNKYDVKVDVIRVLHDNKHERNVLHVYTYGTNEEKWVGTIEDDLSLRFEVDSNTKKVKQPDVENINIVESTRQEFGLTYKELGEAIGYDEDSLKNIASKKEVSERITKVIELYVETIKLKKQLKDSDILK